MHHGNNDSSPDHVESTNSSNKRQKLIHIVNKMNHLEQENCLIKYLLTKRMGHDEFHKAYTALLKANSTTTTKAANGSPSPTHK